MQKKTWKNILLLIGLSYVVSAVIGNISQFRTLELKTLDWRMETRGVIPPDDVPIVIVTIDDISFGSLPDRWPWPRSYYAHAIRNILEAGALVVGVDVILDKEDPYRPDHDQELVDVLHQYADRVVLVGKVLPELEHLITPHEKFLRAGATWGTVGLQAGEDGFYRQYLFVSPSKVPVDTVYPSLGAELLKEYFHMPENETVKLNGNQMVLGKILVPMFSEKKFLINFFGPAGTFPYVPFVNVVDDSTLDLGSEDLDEYYQLKESGVFRDKIVLIGSTIAELHDNFATPFISFTDEEGKEIKREMPGVEIHANALGTILTNRLIKPVPGSLQTGLIFLLILVTVFIVFRWSTFQAGFSVFFMIVIYALINYLLFTRSYLYLELITPMANILIGYFTASIFLYIQTQREKQMILGAFTHYVPQKVVEEIIKDPEKLSLGGEEREITILFSDIANFTTISEKLEPRRLVSLINEYLTEMTDIILKNEGIIDKYEGDAIMAEFGVPVFYENHPHRACLAALGMQARLAVLREKWRRQGYPEIFMRIGINTGVAIIGNMGSRDVFDYTAMGDSVNLAARLESANKNYGTSIMISEFTAEKVKEEFWCRTLDLIRVKGKEVPVKVYELVERKTNRMDSEMVNFLQVFEKGFQYYLNRDWQNAIECFRYCIRYRKEDRPSAVYLRRIYSYLKNPPPPDWDGVFVLTEK